MQVFTGQVQSGRERLAPMNLGAHKLVELFDCGNFFTELAAKRFGIEKCVPVAACISEMSHFASGRKESLLCFIRLTP